MAYATGAACVAYANGAAWAEAYTGPDWLIDWYDVAPCAMVLTAGAYAKAGELYATGAKPALTAAKAQAKTMN